MKYQIYGLIHPKTNRICYVGLTTRKLKERLAQHNNPVKSNPTKIAKLKRSLKELKFSIVLLKECSSKEDMLEAEIFFIKLYKDLGFKVYNITDGGEFPNNKPESIQKMLDTRKKRNSQYVARGEDNSSSILKESEVIKIYSLIKQFYSNQDIIEKFNFKIKTTHLASIRFGNTWKYLFKENFNEPIPSLKNFGKNSYDGRTKVKIVELLDKNYDPKRISKFFNKVSYNDLLRIKNREIWKPVWEVYTKFKKCPMLVTT